MLHPHACAPAARAARTRSFSSSSDVMVSDRTYHSIADSLGTMFGLSPALVNIPCTLSVGRMCCRSADTHM